MPAAAPLSSATTPTQNMMRMLDMTSSTYQQRSELSSTSPASSPQHSPTLPPRHLTSSSHPQLSSHGSQVKTDHQPPPHFTPSIATSSIPLSSSPSFPSSLPIFSSPSLPPDPFSALQDLRLSHPSLSQWLQHVNSNTIKTDPVSPRLEQSPNLPISSDYQRN